MSELVIRQSMSGIDIFLPVLAHIVLILFLYVRLGTLKGRARRENTVNLERSLLHEDAWPDYVLQVNNNIRNQFELPLLFYIICLILWATRAVDPISLGLSWLFVILRYAHTTIHIGSNRMPLRRQVFSAGAVVLILLVALASVGVVSGL